MSLDLLIHLKNVGLLNTGIIRNNGIANCPLKDSYLKNKERGSFDYRFDKDSEVLSVKWKDSKVVRVATNFDSVSHIDQLSVGVRLSQCGARC